MITHRGALIVERSPSRRSLLAELLQELGFPVVVEAVSLANALERMDMIAFDAVFIEVAPGDDSGFSFIRTLRLDRKRNCRVPIIVVSADSQRATIERTREVGANGFLVKPFSRGALKLQVARILNGSRTFIVSDTFAGPDRRRWNDPNFSGPERRGKATSDAYIDQPLRIDRGVQLILGA